MLCIVLNEDTLSLSYSSSPSRPISLLSLAVLCPDHSQSLEGKSLDLSDTMKTERERVVELMDELLAGGTDIKDLIKPITGNVFDEKAK